MNNSLFFILGNPRSGTTLFRLMLNNHPEIAVPPECSFAEWLIEDFSELKIDENIYLTFTDAVLNCKKFETWSLERNDILKTLYKVRPKNYLSLIKCIYQAYAESKNKSINIFGDKNNYYIKNINKLNAHFPNSKKIFLIRDGRDVACSYIALKNNNTKSEYRPKLSYSISEIAKEWSSNAKKILQHENNSIFLRYEDLISDPNKQLKNICNYLNVQYSNNLLDFYKNNDEPSDFFDWKNNTLNPVNKDNQNKYLKILEE